MVNLTQILQNTLGHVNASQFAKGYSRNLLDVLTEYDSQIYRPNLSELISLKEKKASFTQLRRDFNGLIIIPHEPNSCLSLVTYKDSNKMMKKLLLLPLFRDASKADAIKFKSNPKRKFSTALRMARLEDRFVGYDFCDVNGKDVKTVSFVDAIEGNRMTDYYQVKFNRNDYNNQDYALHNGGEFTIQVNSQSGDEEYLFKVINIPLKQDKFQSSNTFWIWQSLSTTHNCPKSVYGTTSFYRPVRNLKVNSLSKRQLKNEIPLDQHVVAAIKSYNQIRSKTQLVLDPIIEFREQGLDYYDKLKNKTLVETVVDNRLKLVPLNQVNRNCLIFDYIKQNPSQIFFKP